MSKILEEIFVSPKDNNMLNIAKFFFTTSEKNNKNYMYMYLYIFANRVFGKSSPISVHIFVHFIN